MLVGRTVLFGTVTGSHNYNLNTPSSDVDWKFFTLPTFEDLYNRKIYSEAQVSTTEDFSAHDVRKLSDLLWKANINFIEPLFSDTRSINDFKCIDYIKKIFEMRDALATMNIPALYSATMGMHYQKMSNIDKYTESTQHYFEKYGYNVKEAHHALRTVNFLQRFYVTGSFSNAVWYKPSSMREILIDIKNGVFTRQEVEDLILTHVEIAKRKEDWYKSQPQKPKVKEKLYELIYDLIKFHIREELQ